MFKTPYDRIRSEGLSFLDSPSLTQKQFAHECDINNIISRYRATGVVDPSFDRSADVRYADVSAIPDVQVAQNIVRRASEHFDALPSVVRARFNNDVALFFEAMSKPENRAEAVKFGVLAPSEAANPSFVQSDVKTSPVEPAADGHQQTTSQQTNVDLPASKQSSAPSKVEG